MSCKLANELDEMIGRSIRTVRVESSVSQKVLGKHLGISYQQIQKYEAGISRVPASRLFEISKYFDLPVSRFFPNGVLVT